MKIEPSGRLELTWTNKHLRLLADEDGSYEWVDPSDYRVAEVRLLQTVGSVGDARVEDKRAQGNLLIRGDALHALTSLNQLPEFSRALSGSVQLVYLDPPFNTGQAFEHYDDALEHSVWLTMMRDRLVQIRELVAPSGSIWVHCDDTEQAYLKAAMNDVFGRDSFVATIIWQKADTPRMDAKQFSASHDYIHCYGRSPGWKPKKLIFEPDLAGYPYVDAEGHHYSSLTLRKWGHNSRREDRPNLWYPIEHHGQDYWPIKPDSSEGYWRWEPAKYEKNRDRIEWADKGHGTQPYVVTYAPPSSERPYETWWPNTEVGHNREAKSHLKTMFPVDPFDTPKPERLLQRIIDIGTEPGGLVLDCFLGSGTTAAVAHKMGRRWIGIESSVSTFSTFALPRLTKVVDGTDQGGVSQTIREVAETILPDGIHASDAREAAKVLSDLYEAGSLDAFTSVPEEVVKDIAAAMKAAGKVKKEVISSWSGGGGFHVLDVHPSMFVEDEGRVVLAEWAVNGALGEATAAQLGYVSTVEPPFCGIKGKTRLAVVDGLVNEGVVRLLAGAVPLGERMLVCGTALDPTARQILKELRPGSTMKKIPASLLDEYRTSRRLQLAIAEWPIWAVDPTPTPEASAS